MTLRYQPIPGRQVIFYGAGAYAKTNFESLKNQITGAPVCFSDANINKSHTYVCGVEVLPLDEALLRYPNYDLLITVSLEKIREIYEFLLLHGISDERIFFPDDIERRHGCVYMEAQPWATFGGKRIKVVSECFDELAIERTGSIKTDLELIEYARKKVRTKIIEGKSCCCDNCFVNIDDFYLKKLNSKNVLNIVFESNYFDTVCNAHCCYCTAYDERRYVLDEEKLKLGNSFLDDWHQLIDLFGNRHIFVSFANGEMTASPWCKEVTADLLNKAKNWEILVPTNGFIFNKEISLLMKAGRVKDLMFSFDAGTRETFYRVKGIDCLDEVIDNLSKYIEISGRKDCISMKYIMLEGLNDNETDFECFARTAKNFGLTVILSNDNFTLPNPMSDNIKQSFLTLVDILRRHKVPFYFGRHCFLASDYRYLLTI